MTPTELDTVTEAVIEILGPAAAVAIELWSGHDAAATRLGAAMGGTLPGVNRSSDLAGRWRAIRVEPSVWWLLGPLEDLDRQWASVESSLAGDGGASDMTGGLICISIRGPDWRERLMIGGVFDAEDPAFGPGCTAGTLLGHIGVRYDVIADDEVHILAAPSYGHDLLHHLRR